MGFPPSRASGPYRPTRIGQWEVIAKIAGGGMSAVYLGRRVEPTAEGSNIVAIKIMRHDLRDVRLAQMFLAEGKLLARLIHPGIVRTLEVGADAEQDYIAMELMLGKTFAAIQGEIAERGARLSPLVAAWVAARIAEALHYAHELTDELGRPLALVHRDVNPANVFATFQGEVKLFDFGLAKVTAGDGSGSHVLAGKLSYLSPEQIMQMPLDRRSDVFSLGTTLWELLTARRLFRRESDLDTVRAVQLGPIPDPRSVAPDVPEELARITRAALERNREHRYPTTALLARELDAFVLGQISAEEVSRQLASLVDALFPEEQKRQAGWLRSGVLRGSVSPPSGVPTSAPPGALGPRTPGAAFAPAGRAFPAARPLSSGTASGTASAPAKPGPAAPPAPDSVPIEVDVSGLGSSTDIQAHPALAELADDTDAVLGLGAETVRDLVAAPMHADDEDITDAVPAAAPAPSAASAPPPRPETPPGASSRAPSSPSSPGSPTLRRSRIPLPSKSAPPPRPPTAKSPPAKSPPASDTKIDLQAPTRKP